ncbi:hypothetical protein KCU67_g571, partial [Aureobasidium melanogenum]
MPEVVQTVQEALTALRRLIGIFQDRVKDLSDRNHPMDPIEAHHVLSLSIELLTDHVENFSDCAQESVNQINELKALIKDLKNFKEEVKSNVATPTGTEQGRSQINDQMASRFDECNKKLDSLNENIEKKLDTIDERINGIDQKLDTVTENINKKLDTLNENVNKKLNTINENINKKLNTFNENMNKKLDTINENVNELKTMMQSIMTSRPSQQIFAKSNIHSIDIPPSVPEMDKPKQRAGMRSRIWGFLRGLKRDV